ncbi:corticotropin-releasing diuretic hormone 44 isoform X3 [Leptinotarsa decemlineata]|uniref:corticotropin-releasing diuretic hormone 44 isoform X3 n=1 Tax=Leptinotarsa decemlineata TaxID=7539 RepID=UPI003D306A2E
MYIYENIGGVYFGLPLDIFIQQIHIMRAPLFVLCAALVVAIRSEDTSAVNTNFFNRQLEPINMAADQETISYLLPKLAAKYRPNSDWAGVTDPRFYLLTEMESNDFDNQETSNLETRTKRAGRIRESGGSLSIVNSLDVLRNRLLLEIARKKAKEGATRNRQMLMSLGKRAYFSRRLYGDDV